MPLPCAGLARKRASPGKADPVEIVLNSKFFAGLSVDELGRKVQELGYDGVDLCVRPGHPVNLENVESALPAAVKQWAEDGLVCPLATAPVPLNDPSAPEVPALFAGCAAAGVPRLKIGFWRFREVEQFRGQLDQAREGLAGFARLAGEYGVQVVYQTHSGPCLGSNCAGLLALLEGFDPRHLGAYPDLGHLALDGEDLAMGLAMIADWLSVVAIKDAYHAPQPPGSEPPFAARFVPVGRGSVDWRRAIGVLRGLGFTGPLTVHTEYNFDEAIIRRVGYAEESPAALEEYARQDAAYLRRVIG
jgi:sugar phosphate isomerase/epimerase